MTDDHREWMLADLLADDETGELVDGDGWTDLHGDQAAVTP
jgi:hypothetical protein